MSDEGLRARAREFWDIQADGRNVIDLMADFAQQIRDDDCKAMCEWCRDIDRFEPAKKKDDGDWGHTVRHSRYDVVPCKAFRIRNLAEKETKV